MNEDKKEITIKPKVTLTGYLTIIFFVVFIALSFYLYKNMELMKENPCKLCVDYYDLDCYSKDMSLHLYRGYDWTGEGKNLKALNNFTIPKEILSPSA